MTAADRREAPARAARAEASPAGAALAVIPCRFGSTRLPGKPLAEIGGRPLVWHVWNGVRRATSLARVLVATDDARIADAVAAFGGEAVMTAAAHASGTDRIAEAVAIAGGDAAFVVNVQGDEPFLDPSVVDRAVHAARARSADVTTAASPLAAADWARPSAVKVVMDADGRALYFSRSGIPWTREGWRDGAQWKHIGLYVYRREALARFTALPPSPLERLESLEQLRALEAGMTVQVIRVERDSLTVDTPEDLERARAVFEAARPPLG